MLLHQALCSRPYPCTAVLPNGANDERISIRPNLELGVAGNVEQIQNWALDDEPLTVSDGGKCFYHGFISV